MNRRSNTYLDENESLIRVLSERVAIVAESQEELNERMGRFEKWSSDLNIKIDKISDKIFEKPEYLSVGEVALRQGISDRTVRRHISKGNIPFERNKGEKSYRIPSNDYYQSLTHNGISRWFQNHTRE
jgi:excisionase family DNA binding protein